MHYILVPLTNVRLVDECHFSLVHIVGKLALLVCLLVLMLVIIIIFQIALVLHSI